MPRSGPGGPVPAARRPKPHEPERGWPPMPAKAKAKGVTLYEETYSHHCVKVRKLLDFKGVGYQRVEVPYHDKRELLRASGQDYVPWLVWEGQGVPWHDIVGFVEDKVPEPSAFPPGMKGQARILEQWAHDILEERVWRYVVSDFSDTFKDEHERWVFEEIQFWKRGPMEKLRERKPEFLADMKQHFQRVEDSLGEHDYLLGDQPSLADFAAYGAVYPLYHVGDEIPKDFPRMRAWWQRVGKA